MMWWLLGSDPEKRALLISSEYTRHKCSNTGRDSVVTDDVDNNGHVDEYDLIQVPLVVGGWVRINMGIYIIWLCIITWMKIIICAKSESQTVLLRVHPISQSTNCIPLNCPRRCNGLMMTDDHPRRHRLLWFLLAGILYRVFGDVFDGNYYHLVNTHLIGKTRNRIRRSITAEADQDWTKRCTGNNEWQHERSCSG